jgi:hypothetical protein
MIGVASPARRQARRAVVSSALDSVLGALPGPAGHRVGDAERDHAEHVVRASYAEGRLALEELSARIEAIHAARTLGELRATVADLPDVL